MLMHMQWVGHPASKETAAQISKVCFYKMQSNL